MEAFSDGVFAIVITLLVLDVHLPDVPASELGNALWAIAPRIIAYATSFLLTGLYWFSHHRSMEVLQRTDGALLWMNTVLLLLVSFIPFPTSLLGRYLFEPLPIVLYGGTLLAANAVGFIMI